MKLKLINNGQYSDTLFYNFLANNRNLPLGLFGDQKIDFDQFIQTQIDSIGQSLDIQIQTLQDSIENLNNILDTTTVDAIKMILVSNITSLQSYMDSLSQNRDQIIESLKQSYYSFLSNTDLQNGLVNTATDMEIILKDVYQIYYNTIAQDNMYFTASQIARLEQIVYMCPYEAGPGLDLARALYSFVKDTVYFDEDVCQQHNIQFRLQHNKQGFDVFPNPANDLLTIVRYGNLEQGAEVVLYDLLGKSVISGKFESGDKNILLDIQKVTSGVYICKLNDNHGDEKFVKLIIAH
jgi:hypothetical protein